MNGKIFTTTALLLLIISTSIIGQVIYPNEVIRPVAFGESDMLRDMSRVAPGYIDRSWKDNVVPNKINFLPEFNQNEWPGRDPVLQDYSSESRTTATVGPNFAGQVNVSGVAPPDTDGDVGPNHYMQMVNLSFQIWDKNGNAITQPALSSTIWTNLIGPWTGTNDGDPVVLYDQYSDRWLVTQFSLPNYPSGPFYELVAVSKTADPAGAYWLYAYEYSNMPDYPKFGIWPDGYYMTINQFAPPGLGFAGAGVAVMNRAAMLNGTPNAAIVKFSLSTAFGSLLPADADGIATPPAGSPHYLTNLGPNLLRIWQLTVNWQNINNSTLELVNSLTTAAFSNSSIVINQRGTTQRLDPLSDRLMHRLQYRKFNDYEVMMVNHTVNVGSGQAGIRWYELRKTTGNWFIYQQGTFAPADGNDRWMGSIAMNSNGDIGLGYSVSGSTLYPSIRVTGQTAANSGTGILDVSETSILTGIVSQTGVNRWGDYSMMSVDPSNDQSFWYTNEYSNGGWNWRTRIAKFDLGTSGGTPPIANFSATPNPVIVGNIVQFTNLSTNGPNTYQWTFEGGVPGSSTDPNPSVQYNSPGSYDVTLVATNAYGSNTKTVLNYIVVQEQATTYCASNSNSASSDYITNVHLGTIDNTTLGTTYSDFTNLTTTLVVGARNTISLTPNTSTRKEFWKVWIDYNGDLDFNDSGEQVFVANNRRGIANGSFTVPSTALTGTTRMRVSMKYGATSTPCEIFSNGEVEDYSVNIATALQPIVASQQTNIITLNLYPNPANEVLNISAEGASKTINIKVYNLLGVILEDFELIGSTTISIDKLAKGLYYVGADDGTSTILKKFVKE